MQLPRRLAPLLALGVLALSGDLGGRVVPVGALALSLSPVTRVVELLQSLSKQIEKDAKEEEDLYETFVCWATSMISQKKSSNDAAQARVDSLNAYIGDLDAGRVELTTERSDLTKQIAELNGDIEKATALRNQQNKEFLEAKDEMQKAIQALNESIAVLKTATQKPEESLLSIRSLAEAGATSEERLQEGVALGTAVRLGEKVLGRADALFLRRLLTGEVPTPDWKKLNRKATFKMNYTARSLKIQDTLAKLLVTFTSNLEDAEAKENEAKSLYDDLMLAKGGEKSSAEEALGAMEKEGGARGLSRQEASDEVSALTTQIADDKGYIGQVQSSLATKKQEWKHRTALRAGELEAISKAISVLHNDDARDLFKKSFKSQGYLFLQEAASQRSGRVEQASEVLRAAGRLTHDARLGSLAASSARNGNFTEVISAIDTMLGMLQTEENEDIQRKEQCEENRATDTRAAIKTSRTMDELTDSITENKAKIEELAAEIKEKEGEVEAIKKELGEAARIRQKENAEYLKNKKDDEDAAEVITNAKGVLETFYTENGLMLVQKKGARQQPPFVSQAGAAPPPPPKTWEEPYGGRTDESTGVIAILSMIHEDVLKDISNADAQESAAVTLYGETTNALNAEKGALEADILALDGQISTREGDVVDDTNSRTTKKGELETVMARIRALAPGCDYFAINYDVRRKNRQIEVDGLLKAKAILSGGTFDAPDPNRELKPGDAVALVQHGSRAGKKQLRLTATA